MKALSVRAPWAGQIIAGMKRREYRPWQTHFRERIWIHECGPDGRGIIGSVEIVGMEGRKGDYAWVLREPRGLKRPIQCKGRLGFWEYPTPDRPPAPPRKRRPKRQRFEPGWVLGGGLPWELLWGQMRDKR